MLCTPLLCLHKIFLQLISCTSSSQLIFACFWFSIPVSNTNLLQSKESIFLLCLMYCKRLAPSNCHWISARGSHLLALASENLPLPGEINPSSFSTCFFFLSDLPLPPLWLSLCHCKTNLFLPWLIIFLSHLHFFHSILDVSTEVCEQKHTTQAQTLHNSPTFQVP